RPGPFRRREGLGDRALDPLPRIESTGGVLEHGLDRAVVAADRATVPFDDALVCLGQAQEQPAEGGLATSRLTHDAQGLPTRHSQVHAVDRLEMALAAKAGALQGEPLRELLCPEHRDVLAHGVLAHGVVAHAASDSPRRICAASISPWV